MENREYWQGVSSKSLVWCTCRPRPCRRYVLF